jgi:hypothetical protein
MLVVAVALLWEGLVIEYQLSVLESGLQAQFAKTTSREY